MSHADELPNLLCRITEEYDPSDMYMYISSHLTCQCLHVSIYTSFNYPEVAGNCSANLTSIVTYDDGEGDDALLVGPDNINSPMSGDWMFTDNS